MTCKELAECVSEIGLRLPADKKPFEIWVTKNHVFSEKTFIAFIFEQIESFSELNHQINQLADMLLPGWKVIVLSESEMNAENPEAWQILHDGENITPKVSCINRAC